VWYDALCSRTRASKPSPSLPALVWREGPIQGSAGLPKGQTPIPCHSPSCCPTQAGHPRLDGQGPITAFRLMGPALAHSTHTHTIITVSNKTLPNTTSTHNPMGPSAPLGPIYISPCTPVPLPHGKPHLSKLSMLTYTFTRTSLRHSTNRA
jgi:hypothetical protein